MGSLALLHNSKGSRIIIIIIIIIVLYNYFFITIVCCHQIVINNLTYMHYHAPPPPTGIQFHCGFAEIPYWWCASTLFWIALLIGHAACEICFNQSKALPRVVTHYLVIVCLCSFLRHHFSGKLGYQYMYIYQPFWYFARLRTRKIQVNPWNATKFTKTRKILWNLEEILSNTCLYSSF